MVKLFLFTIISIISCIQAQYRHLLPPGQAGQQKIFELTEKCKLEVDVDENMVDNARRGVWVDVSEAGKCFLKCFLVNLNYMKDGKIVVEKVMQLKRLVGEEKLKSIIEVCKKFEGCDDNCETAYQLFKCFRGYEATFL